jgi:hypothetical protein
LTGTIRRTLTITALAAVLLLGVGVKPASAAAIGFAGTGGWVVDGLIQDISGNCNPQCDSGFVPFTTGALLADGLIVSGMVRQLIVENGVNTTSALLLVTNIVAANLGAGTVNDNFFIVSDQFLPSIPGPVGVGIFGAFTSNGGVGGNIPFAHTQAQMNFLTTGFITQAAFGGPLTGFALTTVDPFVSCLLCSPVPFAALNFGNDPLGGVEQLVGVINFNLGPGSSMVLPGSWLITNNNNEAILAEVPEPASLGLCGAALFAIALRMKRRKRA